jgi:hypothetical protein
MADIRHSQHPSVEHSGHGHSVAAWSAVAVITFGSLVMAVAVVMNSTPGFVVGAVVAVLGGVLAKVLSSMGYGAGGRTSH